MTQISTLTPEHLAKHAAIAEIRERFQEGVRFRIDGCGYPKKTYTVKEVRADYIVADCGDGITTTLEFDLIGYYENLKKLSVVGKANERAK